MNEQQQLDLIRRATDAQIEAAHKSLDLNIDAADRIHARNASQTIVNIAKALATDPNS